MGNLTAQVAILGSTGAVMVGGAAWREFLETGPPADAAAEGIRAVLAGEIPLSLLELFFVGTGRQAMVQSSGDPLPRMEAMIEATLQRSRIDRSAAV